MKSPRIRTGTSLLTGIGLLTILLSTGIIVIAELAALQLISSVMTNDLKAHSLQTAQELAEILEEPLYILDDAQVLRIGEAVLSSGRVSGLRILSAASGEIISVPSREGRSSIPSFDGTIRRDDLVLGSFHLEFSDREVERTRNELLVVAIGVIAFVIAANFAAIKFIVLSRVGKSFFPIYEGLRAIAGGDYEVQIPLGPYTDINELSDSVNGMVDQIRAKNRDLLLANQTLEDKVAARTSELERSLRDLRLAQDRLVESERLTALGQLSAGMAHELNTPLGAILSSGGLLADFFDLHMKDSLESYLGMSEDERGLFRSVLPTGSEADDLPDLSLSARKRRNAVQVRLQELGLPCKPELADLIVEMGIDGRVEELGPGLRIETAAGTLKTAEPFVSARRAVGVIELAGRKASSVISALRSYLSPDKEGSVGTVDIEVELDRVLTLMNNLLKHGVTVKRSYGGVTVRGSPERLGQVWLNLIRNAAQAVDFQGELEIRTELHGSDARVSVLDSGPGVPTGIRDKIFDPFFTTKKPGEGIGLGLDICRQIVHSHGGSIFLESIDGRTAFTVLLPHGERRG